MVVAVSCADGSVLCAVGYEDGQVRVYSLGLSLSWGSEFKLSSSLATGVPRTSTYPGMYTPPVTPKRHFSFFPSGHAVSPGNAAPARWLHTPCLLQW